MARIAFALELGGELGHVRGSGALAGALALRGHHIAFVASRFHPLDALPAAYAKFDAETGVDEAPAALPNSYADILLGSGYATGSKLRAIAASWRNVLQAWQPDLLLADFAPTALLAARSLGISAATFGNGFSIPPPLSPLPSFRFDVEVDPAALAAADSAALGSINEVLAGWRAPPLANLSQLHECAENFLCTFPELDHYGARPKSRYWGPRFETASGARMAWPSRAGKRILVYMKQNDASLDHVIELLAPTPHSVALYVKGLDERRRALLCAKGKQCSATPIRLDGLLPKCDLVVTHGGGMTTGTLAHGIPQVVFPLQYEQYITARRVEQLGTGAWLGPGASRDDVANALNNVLGNPAYGQRARAFAARYPGYSPTEQRRRVVTRIEQILRESRRPSPAHTTEERP